MRHAGILAKNGFYLWMQSPYINKCGFLGRGQSSFMPPSQRWGNDFPREGTANDSRKKTPKPVENHYKMCNYCTILHYDLTHSCTPDNKLCCSSCSPLSLWCKPYQKPVGTVGQRDFLWATSCDFMVKHDDCTESWCCRAGCHLLQ